MTEVLPGAHTETAPLLNIVLETSGEFFYELTRDIAAAGHDNRIALVTMSFEPSEPIVAGLIHELEGAAGRGAEIAFGVDASTFMLDSSTPGPMFAPNPFGQGSFRRRGAALDSLAIFPNVRTNVLNVPGHQLSNPVAGRSHIKAAVVNDTVYIPGANLQQTARADSALRFIDPTTADKLYELLTRLVDTGSTQATFEGEDQEWQLDKSTSLLIDAGTPGQSIITDRGYSIIDSAEQRALFASQYAPRGRIARALGRAVANGLDVTTLFNHPSVHDHIVGMLERLVIAHGRRTLPDLYASTLARATHYHVKAVANEQTGLTGSSNADPRGERLGTAEISVCRNDPKFAAKLAQVSLSQAGLNPVAIAV